MNQQLIDNWNKVVTKRDTVYHLGDFAPGYNGKRTLDVLNQLNGTIHLIAGNHDHHPAYVKAAFTTYSDGIKRIRIESDHVFLSHYPIHTYAGHYRPNNSHFYGHVHNTHEERLTQAIRQLNHHVKNGYSNMLNVGCMMPYMQYTPQPYELLIAQIQRL